MMRSPLAFFLAALVALLASKVAALNITIEPLGNITANQFLVVNDVVRQDCDSECQPGVNAISQCADDNCLCNETVVTAITACEQCMFTQLISRNKRPDDVLAGQTSALAAYGAACSDSTKVPFNNSLITLRVPPTWDGPFGQGLNLFTTIITVASATVLGSGLIAVVCTM